MIRCQCSFCLHMMDVPPAMAGRKILCPLCNDPMAIPREGGKQAFKKLILRDSIEKFKFTEWDRAFAIALLDQKKLADKQLYIAICGLMRLRRKAPDSSLAQHLQSKGLLSGEDAAGIRGLLKGTVKTAEVRYVDCPNCFADVDSSRRACKFCGQRLSDAAMITCPKCKNVQKKTKDDRVCAKCGANLRTGITEAVRRCPACKELVFGDTRKCPNCKVVLKTSRQEHEEQILAQNRRKKQMMFAGAGAVVLLIVLGLSWGSIRTAVRSMTVGHPQASLENRLEEFAKALQNKDPEVLKPFLSGRLKSMASDDRLKLLCTTGKEKRGIKSVRSVNPVEIAITDDDSAVVTAVVRVTLKQGMNEIDRSVFSRPKTHTVEWHWTHKEGQWFCTE